jgi:hypothetical protein
VAAGPGGKSQFVGSKGRPHALKAIGPDRSGAGFNRRRIRWRLGLRRSYSNVQTVVRNTSWFVSKLNLRRPTVRLSALTVAGLLRTAKGSSFSNTSLLIIREGKSDRRAVNGMLLVGAGELLRGRADRPRECASA